LVQGQIVERNAQDRKIIGKKVCLGKIEEGGHQLAFGQITRSAE